MQFPSRLAYLLGALLIVTLFILGLLFWNKAPYKCFNGKHYYGNWVTVASVGRLELRTRAWGCPPADRYDPKQFQPLYAPTPSPN